MANTSTNNYITTIEELQWKAEQIDIQLTLYKNKEDRGYISLLLEQSIAEEHLAQALFYLRWILSQLKLSIAGIHDTPTINGKQLNQLLIQEIDICDAISMVTMN